MQDPEPLKRKKIIPPPVVVLGLVGLGLFLRQYLPLPIVRPFPAVRFLAGLAILIGAGLLALGAWRTMRRHRTPVSLNKETVVIIDTGPFRHTRNPLYLALLLLYTSLGLLINSAWFLLLLPLLFLFLNYVATREERYLFARFGLEYQSYQGRVRRWL
ncbi:MAG: hypothetical protein A2521_13955 [Deltaproteobacteria bacterium RIFOXYD12_FULL_57_12]|nr:MAG: hypothetical protein A2521_13955 [Deltaproteobacteria bacterium RIFOXYD12_FULL_57_12]